MEFSDVSAKIEFVELLYTSEIDSAVTSVDPVADSVVTSLYVKDIQVKDDPDVTVKEEFLGYGDDAVGTTQSGKQTQDQNDLELCKFNEFTDVTVTTGGKLFEVHKFVLSSYSHYFQNVFSKLPPSFHPVIVLPTVTESILELLIEFMYSGGVEVPAGILTNVLEAAEMLQIDGISTDSSHSTCDRGKEDSQFADNQGRCTNHRLSEEHFHHSERTDGHDETGMVSCEGNTERTVQEADSNVPQVILVVRDEKWTDSLGHEDVNMDVPQVCDIQHESIVDDGMLGSEGQKEMQRGIHLSCVVCSRPFSTLQRLKHHFKVCHTKLTFSCVCCVYCSVSYSDFKQHVKTHGVEGANGEIQFPCSMCSKTQSSYGKLERHVRIHTGEKPYSCLHCSYKCADKANLEKHIRIHMGHKPFTCSLCPYRAAQKSCVQNHMKGHSESNNRDLFKCPHCTFKTLRAKILLKHIKLH